VAAAANDHTLESLQAELAGLQQSIRRLHARRQHEAENIASSRAEFERLTRDRSAGSQSQNVYGYYVNRTTGNTIGWAERFSDGPYQITNNGDQIKVTPNFTLD
jgi:septal ring factor EnvC (AmiA/AmiB activator)